MKFQKIVTALSIFIVVMLPLASLVSASEKSSASWTFMVYLDADNNLDWFGPVNLQQMSDGLSQGANVNVVVLMDRLNLPANIYEVTAGEVKLVQSLGEVDMGVPETLTMFVKFAMENYPATYYFLDMWDHGGGYRGVCWDDSSGHHLSPHDVETAIASAESSEQQRVHVVGFDACLVGMVEVCYELQNVCDIVVGSEMLTPGYGWPYTQLMAYLSSDPAADPYLLCSVLADEYIASYPKYTVQLSVINETAISDFAESLNVFADALKDNVNEYQSVIAGARSASQQRFILGTMAVYYYVDVYKFVHLIGERALDTNIEALSIDVLEKLDNAVFVEAHTAKKGSLDAKQFGLTMNFPPNAQKYRVNYVDCVPCFVEETSWLSFLTAYYASM